MALKVFVLTCILASAKAGYFGHHGGSSISSRIQDAAGNYGFGYQITAPDGSNGRKEVGGSHGVVGSYNLGVIDGRSRWVDYVADGAGFRALINTNEPGTAASHPAGAKYNSPYSGPIGPTGFTVVGAVPLNILGAVNAFASRPVIPGYIASGAANPADVVAQAKAQATLNAQIAAQAESNAIAQANAEATIASQAQAQAAQAQAAQVQAEAAQAQAAEAQVAQATQAQDAQAQAAQAQAAQAQAQAAQVQAAQGQAAQAQVAQAQAAQAQAAQVQAAQAQAAQAQAAQAQAVQVQAAAAAKVGIHGWPWAVPHKSW